jgi:hypothetical protein
VCGGSKWVLPLTFGGLAACLGVLEACSFAEKRVCFRVDHERLWPVQVCFKRNVHGRSREDVLAAAGEWEATPPVYPQLEASAWLRGSVKSQASGCDLSPSTTP